MRLTYYRKDETGVAKIATVGIFIPEWRLKINNISIIKGKSGGWFICLPSFKTKDMTDYEKVIDFEDKTTNTNFINAVKKEIEKYAREKGVFVG